MILTIVGISIGAVGISYAIYRDYRLRRLRAYSATQSWLNSDQLDAAHREIWAEFNSRGGVLYETKIFSQDYPARKEYALKNIDGSCIFNFTRILTLETKEKRDVARLLLSQAKKGLSTRSHTQIFHNEHLTKLYLGIDEVVPEPTYNFLIYEPAKYESGRADTQREALFAWSKVPERDQLAGFRIHEQDIIHKLERTHQQLLKHCARIREDSDIDKVAEWHYDSIKNRFRYHYENRPDIYDVFAKHQILNPELPGKLEALLMEALPSSGTVLDVGCGTGILLDALAPKFPKVQFVGADPMVNMLEFARRRNLKHQNVQLLPMGVDDFRQPEYRNKYDVVLTSWGFFDWSEKGEILESITKPGGLHVFVHNWGEDDDFAHLWPEPALEKFAERRARMKKMGYGVDRLRASLDTTKDDLYASMCSIFGAHTMKRFRKSDFSIDICIGAYNKQ